MLPPSCRTTLAPSNFLDRLEALISVYAFCRGDECHHMYLPMHPDGSVTTFQQAMSTVSHSETIPPLCSILLHPPTKPLIRPHQAPNIPLTKP